jgi:hypothetical protein
MFPGSPVEAGAETVRPGGAAAVHQPDGTLDLFAVEGANQRRSVHLGRARVEVDQVERPGGGPGTTQQVVVEGVERVGLAGMIDDVDAAAVEGADGIPAKPLRGPGVEELGVFVSFPNRPKLATLFLVRGALLDRKCEGVASGASERDLR